MDNANEDNDGIDGATVVDEALCTLQDASSSDGLQLNIADLPEEDSLFGDDDEEEQDREQNKHQDEIPEGQEEVSEEQDSVVQSDADELQDDIQSQNDEPVQPLEGQETATSEQRVNSESPSDSDESQPPTVQNVSESPLEQQESESPLEKQESQSTNEDDIPDNKNDVEPENQNETTSPKTNYHSIDENHMNMSQDILERESSNDVDMDADHKVEENKQSGNQSENQNENENEDENENGCQITDIEKKIKDKNLDKSLFIPQSHEIVIPSYSKWFNLNKIHPIEKKSIPEYFTNRIPSKTPQVYVKCRNFMVNTYRINPNEYFSVTAARRNISGDAATLFRLHRFLMKWGLINYQVDSKLLPKNVEPPLTSEYSTRHDAPRGLFPFESYKPSVQLPDMAKLKKMMDLNDESTGLSKYLKDAKRKYDQINFKAEEVNESISKNDKELSQSSSQEQSIVKRANILNEIDDVSSNLNIVRWEKEELKKLLSGIQIFGTDWYKIAKEIGNKTPEQCILKFIQLPIEDKYLHNSNSDSNSNDLGPLKYAPHLPFSKTENPVVSTIAFLVGLVDPKIVQNMTTRAIQKFDDLENKKNLQKDNAREGSEIAISSVGLRSHIFTSNEERALNSVANQLVEVQLQKVDKKLKLLNKIEKSLELEKKFLQKQQEDVLLQRLSITRHSNTVYNKFNEVIELMELGEDSEALKTHLSDIKSMLLNPPILSIGPNKTKINNNNSNNSNTPDNDILNQDKNVDMEDNLKPVSIDAPRLYRYWSA